MARDENVKIFQDTEERVKKDPGLQEAVKHSVAEQVLIPEMMEVTDLMPGIREKGYVFTILHQRRIPEVV